MTARLHILAARRARDFARTFAALRTEGAGNAGCPMHPQPRTQNKKRTSVVTTVTPERPGIPRAMVLRLTSRSPRRPGLFDTVACASYRRLDAGIGASERHDFAVRQQAALVSRAAASIASRPAFVTIASRPSVGRDRIAIVLILSRRQVEILKIRNRWNAVNAGWPVDGITAR